jgi:hypothetical protein
VRGGSSRVGHDISPIVRRSAFTGIKLY